MLLAQLALHNFRNIESAELEPHPLFNIFHGANAQGKTNILESIFLLGSLKSFRAARNEELIRHDCNSARITGRTSRQPVAHEIRLDIDRDGKTARLDGKSVSRPETYLDCLRPIIFAPEEVSLVKGPPAGRRRLLDRAVFQTGSGFLANVQDFGRQLKQRNRLLKEGRPTAEIEPWSRQLASSGARIRYDRTRFLQRIMPRLTDCYRRICGEREEVTLVYGEAGESLEQLEQRMLDEFSRQQHQEHRYGMTLSGPHRDDIEFLVDGRPLKNYGSQGQHRSFILAFKAAQAIDMQQLFGHPPLMLFDDLTGELDNRRQGLFSEFLLEMQAQVFITTTDIRPLQDGGIRDGSFIRVEDGCLHAGNT